MDKYISGASQLRVQVRRGRFRVQREVRARGAA